MKAESIKCPRCEKSYPAKLVSVWKQTNNNGNGFICRNCAREKRREYRLTERGREVERLASRRAYIKHKEKWMARAKVRYAVKTGLIIKPKICSSCLKKLPLQGHHEDYSKPLEIVWLCFGCHADADRKLLTPLIIKRK